MDGRTADDISEEPISEEPREIKRWRKKSKFKIEKQAKKIAKATVEEAEEKTFAEMTKEERLREIYKEDQVMCGQDNQHIYADIIKDVFMKEI